MKLTLYKGCEINKTYAVCYNTANGSLEKYLNGLDNYSVEISGAYTPIRGTLYLDYTDSDKNPFYYSYLKIEMDNGNVAYAFVDDVTIVSSEVCEIAYTEDIFHTYSKGVMITQGIRDRIYDINEYKDKGYPFQLIGEKQQTKIPQFITVERPSKYVVIAQLQIYTLEKQGKYTSRVPGVFVTASEYDFDKAVENALGIAQHAGFQNVTVSDNFDEGQVTNYAYYDVDRIFIVPSFISSALSVDTEISVYCLYEDSLVSWFQKKTAHRIWIDNTGTFGKPTDEFFIALNVVSKTNPIARFFNDTVSYGEETLSVGTFSTQIGLPHFNTDDNPLDITANQIDVEMYYKSDGVSFNLIMYVCGNAVDVTDDFELAIPFEAVSGEVNATRKLDRTLKILSGTTKVVTGAVSIAADVATFGASSTIESVAGKVRHNKYGEVTTFSRDSSRVYKRGSSAQDIAQDSGGIAGGIIDLVSATKQAQSNYISHTNPQNVVANCEYFICTQKVKIDNETQLNDLAKDTGYATIIPVEKKVLCPLDGNELTDVYRFQWVNLRSVAPQRVMEMLTRILLNGYVLKNVI